MEQAWGHGRHTLRRIARAACAAVLLGALSTGQAAAAGITNSGSDLRDGWYPNQPRLAPDSVSSNTFGQLWQADVDGQVYAQPLVDGKSVIVATERNQIYSLDSETGAKNWSRNLGASYPASLTSCGDLYPDLGVTSTPVIDSATDTIYLTHKTYASGSSGPAAYYMDALDAATGTQRAGFPKKLTGAAQNAPGLTFNATTELQRPGLLLLDGVIYAGFGGHCDNPPYQGWVFGVSTSGAIKARWSAVTSGNGAGIWQSGAGLMSDGPGRIFVSTGNGGSPTPPLAAPGNGMYGESIVRLDVQPDGSLKPGDFFAPSDAAHLDDYDADFASGGVTALRDDVFGSALYPHVGVAVGKAGYVYLLNRDNLGGIQQGLGLGDKVISRVGPYGGVWSRPGVWPGDGGWIAIPTASPSGGQNPEPSGSSGYLKLYHYSKAADGTPSLSSPVQSDDSFGFSSGAPIITSDGTTSGSALLWIVWAPNGWAPGAQLRAYDAVPKNGHLNLRRSFPIGQSSKFSTPGVGAGRMYVGTRDGHVIGFGAPVKAEVQGPSTSFPLTTVGATSTTDVKLTISGTVAISSISASPATFAARPSGLPATYADGSTVTVPVDFTPTDPGSAGGTLTVTTDKGIFTFSLTGTGQAQNAVLTASPPVISFGGAVVGQSFADTITLGNGGGQPLTIQGVTLPGAPFTINNAPAVGDVIAPGQTVNVAVHYAPTAVGDYNDALVVDTTAGQKTIGLSGTAGLGPQLALTPAGGWDFGTVVIGSSKTVSVTVANTGDSDMPISKSKPPVGSAFSVLDALDEATVIPAGQSRTVRVTFTPTARGTVTDTWVLNAGDGSGVHDIPLTGTAIAPAHLTAPAAATVPDTVIGDSASTTVSFGNDGDLPLTVTGVTGPAAPFAVTDAPAAGTTIAPGGSLTVHVAFSAPSPGAASDSLTLQTSAGEEAVALSAQAVTSGALELTPGGWDFGDVPVGSSATTAVTLRNTGAGSLRILASAPPAGAPFTVLDDLPAGTVLAPGDSRSLRVRFDPIAASDAGAAWTIATSAGAGTRTLALAGRGTVVAVPPLPDPPPDVTPPPVGPDLSAQGTLVEKVRPDLRVSSARLSRDGRKVVVAGRVAPAAQGPLSVTISARMGRKTVTTVSSTRLRGRASFAFTLVLPRAALSWKRLRIGVRFAGSTLVWPGAASLVLVRDR